jgi:2-desacetyl-2-hydroxyethyl bacteriochlorophyllide A dehydrogenase
MQALRLAAVGKLELAELPLSDPGAGEIVVRVLASGICGTDRHLFLGEFPCRPPVTLGHEFAGLVEAAGPGVTRLKPGDLVTIDPNLACGTCEPCREGRINLCRNLSAIGVHRDGGLAEYALVPEHRAILLPPDLDPALGAFCEPLSCCLHGFDLGDIRPGMAVAVLGGGVIGQLMVQLAARAGSDVTLITRNPVKQALALTLGAAAAGAGFDTLAGRFDVVFECAGVPETFTAAPSLARSGGRVINLGVLPQGTMLALDPFDLLFREVALIPAFLNPNTQSRAAALLAAGSIRAEPLISRKTTLAEAADVIAHPPRDQDVKVIVLPQSR